MRVFVTGYGMVKISRWFTDSLEDLAFRSFKNMIARLDEQLQFDALIVSNSFGCMTQTQNILSGAIAEDLGISGKPVLSVENGGAGGASAVLLATSLIKAGIANDVLVIGVEKMTDYTSAFVNHALSTLVNSEHEAFHGATPASIFALMTRSYLRKFGFSEDALDEWPVLMHENALDVPHAQLRFRIAKEQVRASEIVSEPLRVLHSPPIGDGAAALLISGENSKIEKDKRLAEIKGVYLSSHLMELSLRENIEEFPALRPVRDMLEKSASTSAKELDIIDVSDDYVVPAPIILEELGISERGRGLKDIQEGRFRPGDKPSVNLTGGTKARGHPYGATGVYQIAELVSLLSDGKVKNSPISGERGLAVSMGGAGAVFGAVLLEKA